MTKKKSPIYNYRSPRDYEVFNMGNEADPPFQLKSGNTTPFKQMGSSPLKQGNWDPKFGEGMLKGTTAPKTRYGPKNPLPKDFNIKGDPSKTPKWNPTGTKGKSGTTLSPHTKPKNIIPKKVSPYAKHKNLIPSKVKIGVRGLLGTAGAAASLLYSFGKESVRRKKAGLSGFNIKKTPTNRPIERHAPPKIQSNKPFTFNKPK